MIFKLNLIRIAHFGLLFFPANEKRQKFANLPKTGSLASYDVIFPDLTGGGKPCPR